jgi:hypothetical protein
MLTGRWRLLLDVRHSDDSCQPEIAVDLTARLKLGDEALDDVVFSMGKWSIETPSISNEALYSKHSCQ